MQATVVLQLKLDLPNYSCFQLDKEQASLDQLKKLRNLISRFVQVPLSYF